MAGMTVVNRMTYLSPYFTSSLGGAEKKPYVEIRFCLSTYENTKDDVETIAFSLSELCKNIQNTYT